ncbi:hypothetical protein BGZ76_008891 [Entomortierella beljakovae]|nr:hypothetical protein BGZ76_008891 [Entomortierella beljakovae]
MLRATAAPAPIPGIRQSMPGRRPSPSASLSSAGSSPVSTLSTKEQRQLQLQALQRQQQLHFKMQRQQEQLDEQYLSTVPSNELKHEPSTSTSQDIKDTWINIADDIEPTESTQWDRRLSHLSDKHMDTSATRLLEDETPPKIMDGSWRLDDLDDDHKHNHHYDPTTPTTTQSNERKYDSKTNQKNNDNNDNNTPTSNEKNKFKFTHGNVHMSKDTITKPSNKPRSRNTLNLRNANADLNDIDRLTNGSPNSSHVNKNLPTSHNGSNSSKYPWRDTRHETIFTDLAGKHDRNEQLLDHQKNDNVSDNDTSSSLSYGEIMEAVHKGDESMDPIRFKRAKMRLAALSNDEETRDILESLASPAANSPAGRAFQNNQEAFQQQRLRVINAATKMDLNDNRSLAPTANRRDTSNTTMSNVTLNIQTAIPRSSLSGMPTSSRSSRYSYGTRHRSQACDPFPTQPLKIFTDTEIGDRGSTTSRDSAYRDSLSGSTLGSAGIPTQLDLIKKHEIPTALSVFNAAAVSQLFPDDDLELLKILPRNVNVKTPVPNLKKEDIQISRQPLSVDVVLSEDTDATPRPKNRISNGSSQQVKRINPENDAARAKQYSLLASRGLSKQQQSISFVEELANATAMKSATDISFKNVISPDSKKPEQQTPFEQTSDSNGQREEEILGSIDQQVQKRDEAEKSEAEDDDLGLLAQSHAVEDAFQNLLNFDDSIDFQSNAKDDDIVSVRRAHMNDEGAGDFLSAVSLPSKPRRRGEYSLKWENQTETNSIANTSHVGSISIPRSRSSSYPAQGGSGMVAEQSSFSHANDYLVSLISKPYPYDEWDQLKSLDLSKSGVESTITLNQLVPYLEVLILNDNQVPYLTGVPKSVKTLQVRANLLDDLTNFSHLLNLQYLDISHNGIQDLTGLSCLVHLRELIAEGNKIKSLSALQQMDGLIRLDVSHNCLTSLDFRWSKLQRLEYLNASHNKIEQLENLESLAGLIHANLSNNCIEDISLVQPLRRLRILRLSRNKLVTFEATPFPGLRTLYLDDNRLQTLENCQKLTRLENFSVRDQEGQGIAIDMLEFINSRKLYLSGNPIHALYFDMGFYRLEYLEICAGCLSELPIDFAALFPNLRGLNLSYNELDSISALDGLHRLRRLIFVGNNLKSFSDVLSLVKRMRSLVTLDLRHNPLTSNMYPAMSVREGSQYQDTYRTNQSSETEQDWRRRDVGFRRALPDSMYVKRSVYRSAILKSCKRLEWFDGGNIQPKERHRAPDVLSNMVETYGWNYLVSNRREDDEEDYDYDVETGEYHYDGDMDPRDTEWDYNQNQIEQLNQEEDDIDDDGFNRDERDPEDITDDSKRLGSSVDSGSLNGQRLQQQQQSQHLYTPKSPSRFSGVNQPQQPRRLRSLSGYNMTSPSPRTMPQPVTPSQPLGRKTNRRLSSSEVPIGQQGHGNDEGEEAQYETSEKRSAVRSWRDEVNEVSHRKSPKVRVSIGSSSNGLSAAASQEILSKSQMRHEKASGSRSGSSQGSQNGGVRGARSRLDMLNSSGPEISTTAVANNSGENVRSQERRAGTRRIAIPAPQPPTPSRRLSHTRRRSDGNAISMMTPNGAPTPRLNSQNSIRPRSQHGVIGFDNIDAQFQQQLSMSPMGGPSGVTASGTILRPNHHRRLSSGIYSARKAEILGGESNVASPSGNHGPMSMSMSAHMLTQSPVVSPGYFGMSHNNMQSPFGFGKGSIPNTPSRGGGGGGRASRVSLGQGSHHYPQTLARDMELSEMEN